MSPGERVMMAAVAVVAGTLLVGGLRRGEMTGEYNDHSVSAQPIQFALSALGYGLAFILSVFFALGFETQDLWRYAAWFGGKP